MNRTENISVFWKFLFMNFSLLLLSLVALALSNKFALRELTEENLKSAQISLERNTDMLAGMLYQSYTIPEAVENTRYYQYFGEMGDDEPELKYIPALSLLQKALRTQTGNLEREVECLLYLPVTKNICGRHLLYASAEECFLTGVRFADRSPEELCRLLESNHGIVLLPMQAVSLSGQTQQNYLTLIIKPIDSALSVITLYQEQLILEYMGVGSLPEAAGLQLRDSSGTLIYEYPQALGEDFRNASYEIKTAASNKLGLQAAVYIPKGYYRRILQSSYQIGMLIIIVTILAGICLSLLFSNISVLPLRRLLITYNRDTEIRPRGNEISGLDRLIYRTQNEVVDIRNRLTENLLMRAFAGSVLSDAEEKELWAIPQLNASYRVAIIHTSEIMIIRAMGVLRQFERDQCYCVMLDQREAGVLVSDDAPVLDMFRSRITELLELCGKKGDILCCGISAPAAGMEGVHQAARQARLAMPQNGGIEEYHSARPSAASISWLQHERLYQCIFAGEEEHAMVQMEKIAKGISGRNAREIFYNIRFVICCAAEESEVELSKEQLPEYRDSLLPRENVQNLSALLREVFRIIREKKARREDSLRSRILQAVQDDYANDMLCSGYIAKAFDIPKNRVYEMVRQASGKSFNEYVLSVRMHKAAELLSTTDEKVLDIAQACGYPAESTFYRVFRKYYGISPTQYRYSGPPEKLPDDNG